MCWTLPQLLYSLWFARAARLPCLVHHFAMRSFCAPSSSSCSPCSTDRCQTARRCAQCFTLCIRDRSGSPKTQCQVTVINLELLHISLHVLRTGCLRTASFDWEHFCKLGQISTISALTVKKFAFGIKMKFLVQFHRIFPLGYSSSPSLSNLFHSVSRLLTERWEPTHTHSPSLWLNIY